MLYENIFRNTEVCLFFIDSLKVCCQLGSMNWKLCSFVIQIFYYHQKATYYMHNRLRCGEISIEISNKFILLILEHCYFSVILVWWWLKYIGLEAGHLLGQECQIFRLYHELFSFIALGQIKINANYSKYSKKNSVYNVNTKLKLWDH